MTSERIYMVGPAAHHRGGISRYVGYISKVADTDESVQVRQIDSYAEGGLRRVLVFGLAAARVIALPRGSHVHFNMSIGGSTLRKCLLSLISRARRHRFVVHIHGSGYPEFLAGLGPILRTLIENCLRGADAVLLLSESDRDNLQQILGIEPSRYQVLSNGVPGPEDPPETPAPYSTATEILFLGDLGPRKGAQTLVRALARLPERSWHCTIAGTGDVSALGDLAAELHIANVTVHAWLGQLEVEHLLRQGEIFVLPSSAEGLPLSVLEAMAHGLAIIASPVGGLREALEDGAGILVEPGDDQQLSCALDRLILCPEMRAALGRRSRRRWEERFDIAHNWRRLKAIHGFGDTCAA